MAGSVNKVILIGNLGRDPQVRTFDDGGRIASFSVATSERWKVKSTGETKERTEWHQIKITSDPLINVVEKYLKKGMKVYIEGQLETRKWNDKDGADRTVTEVVVKPYRGVLSLLQSSDKTAAPDSPEKTLEDELSDAIPY